MKVGAGDYLLPVDKPVGPTSHDVVAMARRGLRTRRVGHTGTLDPFASGLLVLCIGHATRLAEYLSGLGKRYEATALLGVTTDTLDSEGEVLATSEGWREVTEDNVRGALEGLRGTIEQIPPQYSAKKVDGEAMHRRARRGEHVDLDPVSVTVHDFRLEDFSPPHVRFSVHCSSGTYVRALARDLGEALGVGAHLTELRRTAVGDFSVESAVSVADLADERAVSAARIEPTRAVSHLERVEVDEDVATRLRNGQRVRVAPATEGVETGEETGGREHTAAQATTAAESTGSAVPAPGSRPPLVAVSHASDLLAIAELDDGLLRPRKVFPA